jgi:hypothetical protein
VPSTFYGELSWVWGSKINTSWTYSLHLAKLVISTGLKPPMLPLQHVIIKSGSPTYTVIPRSTIRITTARPTYEFKLDERDSFHVISSRGTPPHYRPTAPPSPGVLMSSSTNSTLIQSARARGPLSQANLVAVARENYPRKSYVCHLYNVS